MLNQLFWISTIKTVLDFFSSLATIGMCIAAFIALKQITITKKINKINNQRESIKIAIDQSTIFTKEIIPAINKLFDKIEADNCLFFKKFTLDKTGKDVKCNVSATNEEINHGLNYTNQIIEIINSLDSIAIYFINQIGNIDIAFNAIGTCYVDFLDKVFPILICLDNYEDEPYYKLYILWSNKIENLKNQKKIQEYQQKICNLHKKQITISTINPLGTDDL